MTQELTTKIAIFQKKEIRKVIHNNEWYFSVSDVINMNPKCWTLARKDKNGRITGKGVTWLKEHRLANSPVTLSFKW